MNQVPQNIALTVFIVDDDDDIRSSLVRGLEKRGYRVEAFPSASAFLDRYDGSLPGCLILDYGMPGMTGLELQSHIVSAGYVLPIIFISGHGGVPETVQAIKAGAIDFIEKPFSQSVLAERIDASLAIAREWYETKGRRRTLEGRFGTLTAREMEIVDRILDRPSEISSKEIAAHLGISPRTVDHHRARILSKLDVRSLAELIALAKR